MRLPGGENAIVEDRKLLDYVLNPDHPLGKHHAILLRDLLGFDRTTFLALKTLLLTAARDEGCVEGQPSPYGRKFEQRLIVSGPAGERTLLAVWILERGGAAPRLVTCYVE